VLSWAGFWWRSGSCCRRADFSSSFTFAGGAADREMLKVYHDHARRIWLALAALYGLALKP